MQDISTHLQREHVCSFDLVAPRPHRPQFVFVLFLRALRAMTSARAAFITRSEASRPASTRLLIVAVGGDPAR